MGIKGLIPFLSEKAPASMSEMSLESLSGEYVAVDASTALYQFTIAIRDSSYFSSLVNSSGESTSHIYGLMSRCSRLLECGIKPVFVFDSRPPDLKMKTLDQRKQKREEASSSLKQAIEEGDKEGIKKFVGRTVKVSKEMNESAKKLLRLMGVPVIEALEEAEAQCAYLARNSLCRFVASEDTDTLVFGGPFLLKNVTASSNKKIIKVDLNKVLEGLELRFEQFVDFCLLCGCDYCETLEGVGPKTAYSLVKRHASLEEIVNLKGGNYEDFKVAKEYFLSPKVNEYDQNSVKMGTLDPEGLTDFLVVENNFSKERVSKFIEKLMKFKTKKIQTSLLSFLTQVQPAGKPGKVDKKKGKTPKITFPTRAELARQKPGPKPGSKKAKVDKEAKSEMTGGDKPNEEENKQKEEYDKGKEEVEKKERVFDSKQVEEKEKVEKVMVGTKEDTKTDNEPDLFGMEEDGEEVKPEENKEQEVTPKVKTKVDDQKPKEEAKLEAKQEKDPIKEDNKTQDVKKVEVDKTKVKQEEVKTEGPKKRGRKPTKPPKPRVKGSRSSPRLNPDEENKKDDEKQEESEHDQEKEKEKKTIKRARKNKDEEDLFKETSQEGTSASSEEHDTPMSNEEGEQPKPEEKKRRRGRKKQKLDEKEEEKDKVDNKQDQEKMGKCPQVEVVRGRRRTVLDEEDEEEVEQKHDKKEDTVEEEKKDETQNDETKEGEKDDKKVELFDQEDGESAEGDLAFEHDSSLEKEWDEDEEKSTPQPKVKQVDPLQVDEEKKDEVKDEKRMSDDDEKQKEERGHGGEEMFSDDKEEVEQYQEEKEEQRCEEEDAALYADDGEKHVSDGGEAEFMASKRGREEMRHEIVEISSSEDVDAVVVQMSDDEEKVNNKVNNLNKLSMVKKGMPKLYEDTQLEYAESDWVRKRRVTKSKFGGLVVKKQVEEDGDDVVVLENMEEAEMDFRYGKSKRVLDDDDMTTASDNMNCETEESEKDKDGKKGLRNLFDVLVPYPKPTRKRRN